jgi:hypothetical protein
MAKCDYCGSRILFGGVKEGGLRFCKADCAMEGYWLRKISAMPAELIDERTHSVHQGPCPQCAGPGPVDVHVGHRVYSALVFTRWSSHPKICCRRCARKMQLGNAAFSLVFGWWGFPWGFILTPIQVGRNLAGLVGLSGPKPDFPSPGLHQIVGVSSAKAQYSEG